MPPTTVVLPRPSRPAASPTPPYARAHWFMLASLAVMVAGFWPSFFRPLGAGDAGHTLHGLTATLWILVLALQAWLVSRGHVRWHRAVARGAFVLFPVLCVSALYMVRVMLSNPEMPPGLPGLLAFIDIPSVAFMVVLFTLALRNTRRPDAHRRLMSATVLLGFPPALTRLYARIFAPSLDFMTALHASFVTVELILVALIVYDWRHNQRRLAYPLSLGFFVVLQVLMVPVSASAAWQGLMRWLAAVPAPF